MCSPRHLQPKKGTLRATYYNRDSPQVSLKARTHEGACSRSTKIIVESLNTKWRYEGGRFKPLFLFEITPSRLIIQDGDKKKKKNKQTNKQTKKTRGISNEKGTSYNVQSHITDIFPLASWFLLHKLLQSSVCFQG